MIDEPGLSLGMTVDPYSTLKPLPDWVAFDLCNAYPAPGGNFLLHNTLNGKRCMAMPEVFASLVRCVEFQTIDQHTATIIEQNPGMKDQQAAISQVFQKMLETGIMVSAKATCDRLISKVDIAESEKEDNEPVAAIITWERPQALERLLDSIVKNCDTKTIHRLYVIDDSRKAENINKNKILVEKYSPELDTVVQYFGQDEQLLLIDGLVQKHPGLKHAIRFLVDQSKWRDQWTSGLNRNLALLLSCGRRLVMLDDDTICDVYEPPEPRPHITFSDNPREADFFGSEQEWAHLHQPINPDPIKRHMQCLGLPLSEALNVLGQNHLKPAGLSNATALQVSELRPDSRVLMTECGSLGCPGSSNNTWLPDMAPRSLKRMLNSEQKTTNALSRRKVWSGRNQPHFAPRPNMSQITGFDNRQMLPPYLPIMRSEDRLFGFMLDYIFPSAVTLDYPWAIPHLPLPEREWNDSHLSFKPADNFPGFFFEKVLENKSSCLSESGADRLSHLSALFRDMAAAPDHSLISMYRQDRLHNSSARLKQLDNLLKEAESTPVNWRNYLRNGIGQLNADLDVASRDDFPVRGLPQSLDGTELIAFWKDVWLGFADALAAWPEIRTAAAEYIDGSGGQIR
jgi:hypothetical protein